MKLFFLMIFVLTGVIEAQKKVEKIIPKFRTLSQISNNILPTLKVVYCSASGYERAYEQYAVLIGEKYKGDVMTKGEAFEMNKILWMGGSMIKVVKILLAALVMFKVDVLSVFNERAPQLVDFIRGNRMVVSLSVFLLLSSLESKLTATGQFEIFYNDSRMVKGGQRSFSIPGRAIPDHRQPDSHKAPA